MNNVETLNSIIETLKDGQEGFRAAGHDVESPDLRSLFSEYSAQRSHFASELQRLAVAYGEPNPAQSGSLAGALHRGWINLKAAIAARNAHAILAECERGEDSAVDAYEKALAEPELALDVRETLSDQLADVRIAHDRIRYLCDSMAAK